MELVANIGEVLVNATSFPVNASTPGWYWINDSLEYDILEPLDSGYRSGVGGGMGDFDQKQVHERFKNFRETLDLYTYSDPKTILLICLYVPIFITAFVGNILVLLVVLPNRFMRNVTNCFIVNLAIADLLVTIICMPMAIGKSIHQLWIYGAFMCKITTYMQGVAVAASVFTLMVLSMDRFLAIRHPMTFRSFSTSRYATCILISLWATSISMMVPFLLVCQIRTIPIDHQVDPVHICFENWDQFQGRHIYVTFLFVFMFVMPGCFITVSYSLIGCKLWTEKQAIYRRDSQVGREQTEKVMTGRRRVARMLVALAIVFACCWLPYHLHSLYLDFTDPFAVSKVVEALPFTILLGHANSALNPILYCFMNKTFRRSAAKLLHLKKIRKKRRPKDDAPVNVVVHYQVSTPARPAVTQNLLQRPGCRSWSNSSVTVSRSTAGSLRLSKSCPNTTKSSVSGSISRRSGERRRSSTSHSSNDKDMRVYRIPFSHLAAAEKVLQHEVYPTTPIPFTSHNSKRRTDFKENYHVQDPMDIQRKKREIFNYALSIPTTINEETSRGSRSISPMVESRSIVNMDVSLERHRRETDVFKQQRQSACLSDYYDDSRRSDEINRLEEVLENLHSHSNQRILDEIDIQIHVPKHSHGPI